MVPTVVVVAAARRERVTVVVDDALSLATAASNSPSDPRANWSSFRAPSGRVTASTRLSPSMLPDHVCRPVRSTTWGPFAAPATMPEVTLTPVPSALRRAVCITPATAPPGALHRR